MPGGVSARHPFQFNALRRLLPMKKTLLVCLHLLLVPFVYSDSDSSSRKMLEALALDRVDSVDDHLNGLVETGDPFIKEFVDAWRVGELRARFGKSKPARVRRARGPRQTARERHAKLAGRFPATATSGHPLPRHRRAGTEPQAQVQSARGHPDPRARPHCQVKFQTQSQAPVAAAPRCAHGQLRTRRPHAARGQ